VDEVQELLLIGARRRGGPPSLAAIAARLRTSTRTMQRRLAEDHTSLRNIVDDVRRELAVQYLANEAMTIDEVAFLLGFADSSSFSRAFRRWIRQPPAKFRSAAREADLLSSPSR
jgi:AraC-like DNA-binding protein